MAARSPSSTQTKPGSPVQQWPQRVQVKRRPSWYQGSCGIVGVAQRRCLDSHFLSYPSRPGPVVPLHRPCGSRTIGANRSSDNVPVWPITSFFSAAHFVSTKGNKRGNEFFPPKWLCLKVLRTFVSATLGHLSAVGFFVSPYSLS